MSIQISLFDFAYIPAWFEQLYDLSLMAIPEPWKYVQVDHTIQNTETPILERYLSQVFRKQAIDYNNADEKKNDYIFYVRNEFACFHTGLYTSKYKGIYMCFSRNKKKDTLKTWVFKCFAIEGSDKLKYVQILPDRPTYPAMQWMTYFDPDWQIRVNLDRMLGDADSFGHMPEALQSAWNLPLLIETAIELSRRKALLDISLAVPMVYQGRIQYTIPLYLTGTDKPDVAAALSIQEGYYIAHALISLEAAYQYARSLARPSSRWLTSIVCTT